MTKQLIFFIIATCLSSNLVQAQKTKKADLLAATPPMGWMTWNYFADNITEKDVEETADAMVSSGMLKAGYNYIFIDDGWQGGRDNKNNMIPDSKKFPSGIKALADYVHSKGLKIGIYSDAAPLTCAGYTGSLGFENQDAKTFASWGIDYLKYDYCGAPADVETAKERYKKMAAALRGSGRDIAFGICEWGVRRPWLWAAEAGGQLWRTTGDVRDKWKRRSTEKNGEGILDIFDENVLLNEYAGPGKWNDMDMLVVGLYGKKGPSGDLGGTGCTDIEYQSQMSLWSILASPLAATNDIRKMNSETKRILMNKEVIDVNQDRLGMQAVRKINDKNWTVLLKPMANGDKVVAILNRSDTALKAAVDFRDLGLEGIYEVRDLWSPKVSGKMKSWTGKVASHQTKLFRLKKLSRKFITSVRQVV
jgi:alpha-galactosidase